MFTQQFAAWMLPWLALLSQLPFGAESKLDDLVSVVLTVGSPVLTAYSLVLTALNESYITSRLSDISLPNVEHAVSVLSGLQQAPLQILGEDQELLALLIALPENRKWWETVHSMIGCEHTWSISAFAGIVWVLIAYILTVVDAFSALSPTRTFVSSDGPGVSSLWAWVRAVVFLYRSGANYIRHIALAYRSRLAPRLPKIGSAYATESFAKGEQSLLRSSKRTGCASNS